MDSGTKNRWNTHISRTQEIEQLKLLRKCLHLERDQEAGWHEDGKTIQQLKYDKQVQSKK